MSGQLSVNKLVHGLPGMREGHGHKAMSVRNISGRIPKIVTFTFTAANSTPYSLTLMGVTLSVTSSAAATASSIRDQFLAAFRDHPSLSDSLAANPSGATLVITSLVAGLDFAASESDANIALAVTQAASALRTLYFGRGVVLDTAPGLSDAVKPPSAAGQKFMGVVSREAADVDPLVSGEGVRDGGMGSAVYEGMMLVETDQAIADQGAVYMRHTGGVAGVFRADADTANADLVARARCITMVTDTVALVSFE